MTTELRSAFIPADLHKWLRRLAFENETSIAVEHEKALRAEYERRQREAAKSEQPETVIEQAVAQ